MEAVDCAAEISKEKFIQNHARSQRQEKVRNLRLLLTHTRRLPRIHVFCYFFFFLNIY
jgi:hypothetical protein